MRRDPDGFRVVLVPERWEDSKYDGVTVPFAQFSGAAAGGFLRLFQETDSGHSVVHLGEIVFRVDARAAGDASPRTWC
jgi:hypothetical protein